jgi:hypothetical protein
VELARGQLARADLVVWVLDATLRPAAGQADPAEAAASEAAIEAGTLGSIPLLAVVNKADLGAAVPFTLRQVDRLRAAHEYVVAGQQALAAAALDGVIQQSAPPAPASL